MLTKKTPSFLLASNEPALLDALEPVLKAFGATVDIVLSPEAALNAMRSSDPPALALIDANLPGMETVRLLSEARATTNGHRFPIVLITGAVTSNLTDWVSEGLIDDMVPHIAATPFWRVRLELILRSHHRMRELEQLREAAAINAQTDPLTGIYNRSTLLSMLFRETDRVQRMKTSLCVILFDIDDFGHWNTRLGNDVCDDLLCQVVDRTGRLLRTYDLFGRAGKDEFLIALPGCAVPNARALAERLRVEVFAEPFHVAAQSVRMSACFSLASSAGRSPVVVLGEAEHALQLARQSGPESIACFDGSTQTVAAPVAFISPSSGDELLAW